MPSDKGDEVFGDVDGFGLAGGFTVFVDVAGAFTAFLAGGAARLAAAGLAVFAASGLGGLTPDDLAAGAVGAFETARGAFDGVFKVFAVDDFMRVFLDIRLPFVAFDGSIFIAAWVRPDRSANRSFQCKFADLRIWLQGFDTSVGFICATGTSDRR